jgi:ferredoxin-NADP reductase
MYTNELNRKNRPADSEIMSNFNQESVLSVHHWTDTLFSFTTTRDPSFRFRNGEFTMIGLKVGDKPLLRAYSVASANYEDRLEFFSIKVPDGPLTSRLQHMKQGDEIIVSRKATGTLVIDNLEDGRNLYLIGTGTGPRDLRPLREGGAVARLPPRRRTRLWRDDHQGIAER